jgi:anti-sigma regulatory factor (Ser/Thr protein kinase)/anti-anti-sigma regulatory factor
MSSESPDLASSLQEAALPDHLAVLPRVDVGATYVLVGADPAGDWFDVVPTEEGRVALVVGDVAGRGQRAVATSLQLRAVLHERLGAGLGVEAAVAAADAFASTLPGAAAATVCLVELHPPSGRLRYVVAGHDPPLVADPDGHVRALRAAAGRPLGMGGAGPAADDALAAGDLLVLRTGGPEIAEAVGRAFTFVGGGHGIRSTVDRVCELVLEDLVARGTLEDDVGLLAAELMPPPYVVDVSVPADPTSLRVVRQALWDWLRDLRAGDHDTIALIHAVGELVSNAVEHAYAGATTSGGIDVTARLEDDGHAVVTVRDHGSWKEPAGPGGRGLALARGLADELRIDGGVHGTTVVLRHRIGRPARMFREPARERLDLPPCDVRESGPGRVAVRGAVDDAGAESLRTALLLQAQGGTSSLVVDLSAVTLLASAGVRVLAESLDWQHGPGALALVATTGSVAQAVLDRVGLPYSEA